MDQPVTERSDELTSAIDVTSPKDLVHLLGKCDAQMFGGYENSKGILADEVLSQADSVSSLAVRILQNPENGLIVLSGCGTSGRIGFLTSRTFGEQLQLNGQRNCYDYIIAGGDKALLTSQELYEDDPDHGAEVLRQVCQGKQQVLYIGITCGLSAPFVAGQLDYCLQNLDIFTPVLLGFNPIAQARNRIIEKWDKTFLQVATALEAASQQGNAFILNPIVGPEPITGSSRMKGGSSTKILLDVIFTCAHQRAFYTNTKCKVSEYFRLYKAAVMSIYRETTPISQLVHTAGNSLKSGGHIYYIGEDTCGILGMVDASECRPTFGAALSDIRGFLDGGFKTLRNKSGDLSDLGEEYHISVQNFQEEVLPFLTERDVVIYSNPGRTVQTLMSAKTAIIRTVYSSDVTDEHLIYHHLQREKEAVDFHVLISLPDTDHLRSSLQELAVKLVYNAVSTGAHVMKGKVFKNLMVDVRISNNKLYHRGVGIIQHFGDCSTEQAEVCLLQSIYGCDKLTSAHLSSSITDHIKHASGQPKVVPVALIQALTGCTVSEAKGRLENCPVIRSAVLQVISDHGQRMDKTASAI